MIEFQPFRRGLEAEAARKHTGPPDDSCWSGTKMRVW